MPHSSASIRSSTDHRPQRLEPVMGLTLYLIQPREIPMERLIFICPKTRKGVDVGIESEISTLLRIREQVVRARCAACGQVHEWPVADAWLATAA
jgi:hypothetical protein